MNKLDAFHDKDNPASGKVMEKSGMRFSHEEPYARMDKNESGRIVTDVHYVLTKEDYFAISKQLKRFFSCFFFLLRIS